MTNQSTKTNIALQMENIKAEARSLLGKWIDEEGAIQFLAAMNNLTPDQRHNVFRLARLMVSAGKPPGTIVQGKLL